MPRRPNKAEQAPPTAKVWPYYVAYAIAMAVIYLGVVVGGVALLALGDTIPRDPNELPHSVTAIIMIVVGMPFLAIYGAAAFPPKKPWTWVYHVVLIGVSLTSACCTVAGIPLLIFWLKPETKATFGKH